MRTSRPRRRVLLLVLVALAVAVPALPAAAVEGMVVEHVWIAMPDGVRLKGVVARPAGDGRFPVVVQYDPYGIGSSEQLSPPSADFLVPNGYAYLAVSIRGTGCSEGSYDQVFSDLEAEDGARVIEWAAAQPWSTGKVGMMGWSYPGITQFFVAAKQPRGLAAIAPFEVLGDLYRDVFYPGGIFNSSFGLGWTLGFQQLNAVRFSAPTTAERLAAGDPDCARATVGGLPGWTTENAGPYALAHPYDGHFYTTRSPKAVVDRIRVPVFSANAWQDEQVGSRILALWDELPSPKQLTLLNGIHGTPRSTPFVQEQLLDWFDRWLKPERRAPARQREAAVTVLLDVDADGQPAQVIRSRTWPLERTRFTPLYLRESSGLSFTPPAVASSASYAYPGTQSVSPYYGLPAAGNVRYLTDPLDEDLLVAGPAELVLHAATTAVDTDWFVALSEVAPDGSVTHVQKGLLRASHRTRDDARSSPGHPYHTHLSSVPVPPAAVVEYRVEILPFAHAFRAGSRLRLDLLTPSALPEPWWGYAATPLPGVNTVHHAPAAPSRLLLPVVDTAVTSPRPPCGTLVGQPCRGGSALDGTASTG